MEGSSASRCWKCPGAHKIQFSKSVRRLYARHSESELFKRSRRDFSHGCIRVEDPTALAAWVLHADSRWTPQAIDAAIHGEQTITVDLPHPLTVVIIYGTAVVPENGEVHFLPDIYGYDARLKTALERLRPLPHS
jgi:murein L,D-transpeptidase YcbB/YkuD